MQFPVRESRHAEDQQVDRGAGDDLVGAQRNHQYAEDQRDDHCAGNSSSHARRDRCSERCGQEHSLDPEIDDAAALHDELALHGQEQGDGGDDRQRDRVRDQLKHRPASAC